MKLLRKLLLLPVVLLFVVGCTGPQSSTSQPAGGLDEDEGESGARAADVSVAPYETFDASQFEERPPEVTTTSVEHSVPQQLLEVRADQGVEQVVDGFQIQVYSSIDRSEAEEVRQDVQEWWEEERGEDTEDLFPHGLPINIEFGQPYYRVRIGAFANREQATEALAFVRDTFEDAFLARVQVTVTR